MKSQQLILFLGSERVACGEPSAVVAQAHRATAAGGPKVSVFDAGSGERVDLDLSGSEEEALGRLGAHPAIDTVEAPSQSRGRGRPRLGVVSREVSLLPRHWQWLAEQSCGASAALRRLVDEARRSTKAEAGVRHAVEVTHRFLWDIAGDLPQFEEVSRALFRGEYEAIETLASGWPPDVVAQTREFLKPALEARSEVAVPSQP